MDELKVSRKIAVHFQEQCVCGQVHTLIHHMKDAEMDVRWNPFEPLDLSNGFTAQVEPERKVEFSGVCDSVEMFGVKWEKDRGVVCQKCGIGLIHGLIADLPEEEQDKQ